LAWGDRVRWVLPESLHLTLRFLGKMPREEVGALLRALTKYVAPVDRFDVGIHAVGLFPSPRSRILAASVQHDDRLSRLAEAVEHAVVETGFMGDKRPFRAHITLGRVRKPPLREFRPQEEFDARSMPVQHIVLYRSDLDPTGARYTELGRVSLAEDQPSPGTPA
jgi:2'-5' RNA ligase